MAVCATGQLQSVLGAFPERIEGSAIFHPICTRPPVGTTIVSNPDTRSTLTIFWSATSIIVLCTYNVLHLNVPVIRPQTESWLKKMWWGILDSANKIKWMVFTFIAPEFTMGKAWCDFEAGRRFPSRTVRTSMANMGYFVLDWGLDWPDPDAENRDDGNDLRIYVSTLERAVTRVLEDHNLADWHRINILRLQSRYWALNAWQWELLGARGIATLPDIPDWQLKKLDGGSAVTKGVAIIQGFYLILQLIVRTALGHPSSQLEISALAFVVCSMFTYASYWNHPQNVKAVHFVQATPSTSANSPEQFDKMIRELGVAGPQYIWLKPRIQLPIDCGVGPEPIPNDSIHIGALYGSFTHIGRRRLGGLVRLFTGVFSIGSFCGALHLLAWNSKFPTPGEAWAWIICTLITTVLPFVCSLPGGINPPILLPEMPLTSRFRRSEQQELLTTRAMVAGIRVLFVPYLLARLFLSVEAFRSLFFLPPGAFANTWSDQFPHLG
jgi:hypothetical protein